MPLQWDDRQLRELYRALTPAQRIKALKGGMRKEANRMKRVAISNLRASGIRSSKALEKGVRTKVYSKDSGFRVFVTTNKKYEGYTNRQGLKKPVLVWAELGTNARRTKGNGGRRALRKRGAHSTGRMRRYGFMGRMLSSELSKVTANVHTATREWVAKTAKKYGAIPT